MLEQRLYEHKDPRVLMKKSQGKIFIFLHEFS